jgi:hypothetical protein
MHIGNTAGEYRKGVPDPLRQFLTAFPEDTPCIILPSGVFLSSLQHGFWQGVLEQAGDFPTHNFTADFNGPATFVCIPLIPRVQLSLRAALQYKQPGDTSALNDLQELGLLPIPD